MSIMKSFGLQQLQKKKGKSSKGVHHDGGKEMDNKQELVGFGSEENEEIKEKQGGRGEHKSKQR